MNSQFSQFRQSPVVFLAPPPKIRQKESRYLGRHTKKVFYFGGRTTKRGGGGRTPLTNKEKGKKYEPL